MQIFNKPKFISVFSLKTNFKSRYITSTTTTTGLGITIFIPFCFVFLFSVYDYVLTPVLSPDSAVGLSYFDLDTLKEMEKEINLHRRNLMFNLTLASQAMSDNLSLINDNFNNFAQANPNLAGNLANVRDSLQTFQDRVHLNILNAEAQRFEIVIPPLNIAAHELSVIIHSLDPAWDSGPDTDDELIQEAAQEMARRSGLNQ